MNTMTAMNSNRTGRRYDREFKNNAVALVRSARTVTDVARDLGVSKWPPGRPAARPLGRAGRGRTDVQRAEDAERRDSATARNPPVAAGTRVCQPTARHLNKKPAAEEAEGNSGGRKGGRADSRHRHKVAGNWPAKVPTPDRPGQLWQSDITYIETAESWLHPAFTLDACSRRCAAHHCREDLPAALTTTTFQRAVQCQRPPAGLIHHSDRGSQYAADAFQRCLRAWNVTASMSRKGNPCDNALAESFAATLKTESFAGINPPTRAAARLMIFDSIETFSNRRRRHSAPGCRSPPDFEKQMSPPNRNNQPPQPAKSPIRFVEERSSCPWTMTANGRRGL